MIDILDRLKQFSSAQDFESTRLTVYEASMEIQRLRAQIEQDESAFQELLDKNDALHDLAVSMQEKYEYWRKIADDLYLWSTMMIGPLRAYDEAARNG